MLAKLTKMTMVIALAIVITILWTGVAVAQDTAGSGPDLAMIPNDDVMTLEEGEYHWYVFNYDFWQGKHTREMEPMEIRLYSFPLKGATLTLRNENQAERWRQDGVHEHFGCCTLEDLPDGNSFDADQKTDYATWSGKLSSGRYYIVVEHARDIKGPVTYQFTMTGDGFFFDDPVPIAPVEAAAPAEAPVPPMVEEVMPEPVAVSESPLMGTGPDYAMRPSGGTMTLQPGEYHWYAFTYDFWEGKHTREMEPMEIQLFSDPIDSATLTLRNENQAELWRQDGKHEHFGCCTLKDFGDEKTFDLDGKEDFATWSGKLSSGRYYIVVEHAKNISGPVTYRFTIEGDGVSYDEPAIVAAPAAPAELAAAPAEDVVLEEQSLEIEPLLGTGPDYAMRPTGGTMTLQSGEYHWYAFTYDFWEGKHTREMDPMEIELYSTPLEGAILTLRNENQAELWRQDGKHEHFGCCTLEDFGDEKTFDADGKENFATWSGKLSSGRYYIVVEHAKNISGPVTYRFTIRGDGVSFDPVEAAVVPAPPADSAEPMMAEELAIEVEPEPVAAAPAPLMGTGPDLAMRPTEEVMTIYPGEYHWFTFDYDFWEGKHTHEMEPMEIRLYSEPFGGATLTLRNEDQAQLWRNDGENEHFGCCTPEAFEDENLFDEDGKTDYAVWAGKLTSGKYYIVVEHAKNISGPVTYSFTMSGDGFSY